MELLVRPAARPQVMAALEPLGWRYSWLLRGPLRLASSLLLLVGHWRGRAVPRASGCAPPASLLGRLSDALWRTAERDVNGLYEPDPAALFVHLAVQSSRTGDLGTWAHARACRRHLGEPARALMLACEVGAEEATLRALELCDAGSETPPRSPFLDGARPRPSGRRRAAPRKAQVSFSPARRAAEARRVHAAVTNRRRRGQGGARSLRADAGCRSLRGGDRAPPRRRAGNPSSSSSAPAAARSRSLSRNGTRRRSCTAPISLARPFGARVATPSASVSSRCASTRVRCSSRIPPRSRGASTSCSATSPSIRRPRTRRSVRCHAGTIEGTDDDGLGLLRATARDARRFLRPGGVLLLQMFDSQWPTLSPELQALGYDPGPSVPRRSLRHLPLDPPDNAMTMSRLAAGIDRLVDAPRPAHVTSSPTDSSSTPRVAGGHSVAPSRASSSRRS